MRYVPDRFEPIYEWNKLLDFIAFFVLELW